MVNLPQPDSNYCVVCNVTKDADHGKPFHDLWVCDECVDQARGPGKFEAHKEDEELRTAIVLYALSNMGYEDECMGNVERKGYISRFNFRDMPMQPARSYFMKIDNYGFVEYESAWEDKADQRWKYLYDIGYGSDEDDGYITENRNKKYEAILCGEELGVFDTHFEAKSAILVAASNCSHYPDIWVVRGDGEMYRLETEQQAER
jgi:hypothetical protein